MANPIAFHSQSARLPAERKVISKSLALKHRRPLALFFGKAEIELIKFGEKLGFFCILYGENSDPSYVVQAKVIIVQNMQYNFIRHIGLINMAVSYGIPTVWVHSLLPPGRWVWSFRYSLVGLDIQPVDVWRKICQEVM